MHEVVIELAIGIVPKLKIRVDRRPVEAENFHEIGLDAREHTVECVTDEIFEARCVVAQIHVDEATETDLGPHFPQTEIGLTQAILIAGFLARDVDAVAFESNAKA